MPDPVTGPCIFVAEDDDDEGYLAFLESLREAGVFAELLRFKDGASLLDAVRAGERTPALILLDLNMPRMDGREALRLLRGETRTRDIPIAVLTASQAEEDLVRAYGIGVEYFVRKPAPFEQLVDIIKTETAMRRERRLVPVPAGSAAPAVPSFFDLVKEMAGLRRESERLREHESELRRMVEQAPALLWTTDSALRFTSMAGAALRRLGITPLSVPGKRLAYYFGYSEGDSPLTMHRRALEGGSASFRFTWKNRSFQACVEPLYDASGKITGTIGLALELLPGSGDAVDQLPRAELPVAPEAPARAADHPDLGNDRITTAAGHELSDALRQIDDLSDLVEREESAAERRGLLSRVRQVSRRSARLIEDLTAYFRAASGMMVFSSVDLKSVMDEVLVEYRTRIALSGAQVEVRGLPYLRADPHRMRLLLSQLLGNAIKFALPGAAPRLTVEGRSEAGRAVLVFRDEGTGFDTRFKDQLFLPFSRLHPRPAYEGSGLGLAMCARIVERHGGTIEADGAPGLGATFTVTLPLDPELPSR